MSDLISRQAILDKIRKIEGEPDYQHQGEDWAVGLCIAESIVEEAETAEPERKKGKWIKHENPTLGRCMKIIYECSVCHKAVGCEYFVRRSFCPNCGAEMSRGEE